MTVPVIAMGDVPAADQSIRRPYAVAMPIHDEVWLCWAEGNWIYTDIKLSIEEARATLAALRGAIETYETLTAAAAEVAHG